MLKRYSDAIKDRDRIHGLILGYGQSQEGLSKSMGTPTLDGEALAITKALEDAGIAPSKVQVVEAHGTGTALGDPLEILSIRKAYGTQDRRIPLIITAGKANTGHTESCSGIAGIIKVLLQMKHSTIPRQIGIQELNPKINLDAIPATICFEKKDWISAGPKLAGVSSFGITGTNTHVILQEYTEPYTPSFPREQETILTLSAKVDSALDEVIKKYQIFLSETKESSKYYVHCKPWPCKLPLSSGRDWQIHRRNT